MTCRKGDRWENENWPDCHIRIKSDTQVDGQYQSVFCFADTQWEQHQWWHEWFDPALAERNGWRLVLRGAEAETVSKPPTPVRPTRSPVSKPTATRTNATRTNATAKRINSATPARRQPIGRAKPLTAAGSSDREAVNEGEPMPAQSPTLSG